MADEGLLLYAYGGDIFKVADGVQTPKGGSLLFCRHLDVQEAAVVGAPDAIEGEIAVAFVVPKPGAVVDGNALRRFCRDRLPAYKVPKMLYFVSELPRTGTGKVSKSELRAKASLG